MPAETVSAVTAKVEEVKADPTTFIATVNEEKQSVSYTTVDVVETQTVMQQYVEALPTCTDADDSACKCASDSDTNCAGIPPSATAAVITKVAAEAAATKSENVAEMAAEIESTGTAEDVAIEDIVVTALSPGSADDDDEALDIGLVAGAAVGGLVGLCLVVTFIYRCCCKKKGEPKEPKQEKQGGVVQTKSLEAELDEMAQEAKQPQLPKSKGKFERIQELHTMMQNGILTQQEFDTEKAKILQEEEGEM